MNIHFSDFNITRRNLSTVIRYNNITRKRITIRHFPETRYGKKINIIISIDETSNV